MKFAMNYFKITISFINMNFHLVLEIQFLDLILLYQPVFTCLKSTMNIVNFKHVLQKPTYLSEAMS